MKTGGRWSVDGDQGERGVPRKRRQPMPTGQIPRGGGGPRAQRAQWRPLDTAREDERERESPCVNGESG